MYLAKYLLHSAFFTDHLRQNIVNKTTSSSPPPKYYFLRLSGFPGLFDKVFLVTFKFS